VSSRWNPSSWLINIPVFPWVCDPHDKATPWYFSMSQCLFINILIFEGEYPTFNDWYDWYPFLITNIPNYPQLSPSQCTNIHMYDGSYPIHSSYSIAYSFAQSPTSASQSLKERGFQGNFSPVEVRLCRLGCGEWVDIKVLDTSKYSSGIVKQRCHILGYIYVI
jgi:hypothetical protein